MDYRFLLPRTSQPSQPRQRALYSNLRNAIVTGRLAPHHRLPGSRELAIQLAISRNTIIYAFEQLCAEGYLISSRQGTTVAAVPLSAPRAPHLLQPERAISRRLRSTLSAVDGRCDLHAFLPGVPALDAFPLAEWQTTLKRTFREILPAHLGYGDAAGAIALRQAISDRLRAARNLRCTPDQVFITDGTQTALTLLSHVLADEKDIVWMENPGYPGARAAFDAAGLTIHAVTVDADGLKVSDAHSAPPPRLIYLTPSHQYPMGSVLSLPRRMELLTLARGHDALILEDDYDSDFRYDGEPLPSLQGLIEDSPVVYIGTFSKTMFPGLRLGYVVVPINMIATLHTVLGSVTRHGRQVEEMALARFLIEGRYTRHLSRMRKLYQERRRALRSALARHLPDLPIRGIESGLHLVVTLPPRINDADVCERARSRGINPRPLSDYCGAAPDKLSGLVIGYGNTPAETMERYVVALAACL